MNTFNEGDFLRLNESGSYLWNNLETFSSKDSMIKALQDRYGIDDTTARSGVESFIAGLEQFKAVQ